MPTTLTLTGVSPVAAGLKCNDALPCNDALACNDDAGLSLDITAPTTLTLTPE